jgi:hypothetical protein
METRRPTHAVRRPAADIRGSATVSAMKIRIPLIGLLANITCGNTISDMLNCLHNNDDCVVRRKI